jgi:hypothetical protein
VEEVFLTKGRDVYLVVMARAARAHAGGAFHPAAIERIWSWYTSDQTFHLPTAYQPETIIIEWLDSGAQWLSPEALQTLLTSMLASAQDTLFYELAQGQPEKVLALAIQNSKRSATDVLEVVANLLNRGDLNHQQALNLYLSLLESWEWRKTALPLVEQVARALQQVSTLILSDNALWKMLEIGEEAKNDLIARVAARVLFDSLEKTEDEQQLTGALLRMYERLLWSPVIRDVLMDDWRAFVRGQPLARLQRFDKALDGKRPLEEARNIVQTAVALRKLLGKRTLQELAADIKTAYTVLEALADSFEPTPKHPLSFDQDTVRTELDARENELAVQERTIFANHLKELAQLIASMGDNRSKSNIVRRDLDRQLMTGEQQPQSAVDALKWLAGYLGGAQERDADENE